MQASSAAAPLPRQRHLDTTTQPQYYVPIPERLIREMGRNLLAVGLYALIGRLWRTQADEDGWVTLSTNDIGLFDPSLSRGAILRGLTKLLRYDWLESEQGRYKKRFRPTWGVVRGALQPWSATAPLLGRPKHVKAFRLDQQLLDVYIGKITTKPTETGVIERYVEPMLRLEDVGAYASTLAGYPQTTPPLVRLGLVTDECVVAVPSLATILGQATEVTKRGIQRLGLAPISDPQPSPAADKRPAVFFVTPIMAGNIIRTMTRIMPGCERRQNDQNIPPLRDESAVATANANMTWMTWSTCSSWINPQRPVAGLMGGLVQGKNEKPKHEINKAQDSESEKCRRRSTNSAVEVDIKTEAEQVLLSAGVWPRTAKTLRDAPLRMVHYALEQAHTAQARSMPAYTAEMLKSLKERQWQLPVVPTAETFDIAKYTTGEYAGVFRDAGAVDRDERAVRDPSPPVPAELTPETLWQVIQADLRVQMTPATYQATIAQAHLVQLNGSVVVLAAPTSSVRDALIEQCVASLKRSFGQHLGQTVQLSVVLGGAAPAQRQAPSANAPVMGEDISAVAAVSNKPPTVDAIVTAVESLPETLSELLPALQQQLRHRAAQRQQRELGLLVSAIQAITVERETAEGMIELTPATPTDLWRPEAGDQVVLHIGQSSYLEEVVKAQCELIAEELGALVDRRLAADDIVIRQKAHGRPRRT